MMRGGVERYHEATLDTIQQHTIFEKATEANAATAKGGKKKETNKKTEGKGCVGNWRLFQSSHRNPNHPYNNYSNCNNNNNNYKATTKTIVEVKETEDTTAEAKADMVAVVAKEVVDTKVNTMILTIKEIIII